MTSLAWISKVLNEGKFLWLNEGFMNFIMPFTASSYGIMNCLYGFKNYALLNNFIIWWR